jgi:hypothetical protein
MYKSIVILHGIGDFIAAESFLTDDEVNAVEKIYWASAHKKFLQNGIDWNRLFPNLKSQDTLWDDWGNWGEHLRGEKRAKVENKHQLILVNKDLDPFWISRELLDSGLPAMCDDIYLGRRFFRRSRLAALEYTPPVHVGLPEKFVLIHPFSDSLRTPYRDFDDKDWEGVLGCLEKNNLMGVVVNKSDDYPPQHSRLIDLTNQTTLQETFALAQRCRYYMGCASYLHVLVPKILPVNNIFIRSTYPWLVRYRPEFMFYHAPATQDPNFKVFPSLNFLKDYELV